MPDSALPWRNMFPHHEEDMTYTGQQLERLRGQHHPVDHGGGRSKRSSTEVSRAHLYGLTMETMVG